MISKYVYVYITSLQSNYILSAIQRSKYFPNNFRTISCDFSEKKIVSLKIGKIHFYFRTDEKGEGGDGPCLVKEPFLVKSAQYEFSEVQSARVVFWANSSELVFALTSNLEIK